MNLLSASQGRLLGIQTALCVVCMATVLSACQDGASEPTSSAQKLTQTPTSTVSFSPTDQATAAAAVKTFFEQCASLPTGDYGIPVQGSSGTSPAKCPQAVDPYDCWFYAYVCGKGSFKWTLVGDPSKGLTYSWGSSGQLQAVGHYLMLAAYLAANSNVATGASHDVSGGPFIASLLRSGGTLMLMGMTAGLDAGGKYRVSAPGLADPLAHHAAVLAAVKAYFETCAATTSSNGVADCPQLVYGGCGVGEDPKTAWSLVRDPSVGASARWDSSLGIYSVMGKYDMRATTTSLCNGHVVDEDYGGHYWATVVWSDAGATVVKIGGEDLPGCPFCSSVP